MYVEFYNPHPQIDPRSVEEFYTDYWYMDEDEREEYYKSVFIGVTLGGVPHAIELYNALMERDMKKAIRAIQVELTVIMTWIGITHALNLIQGPKYYLNPFRAPHKAGQFRSLIVSDIIKNPFFYVPAIAVGASVLYDRTVNETIRETSGTSGTWFGPYASGFGSVV